MGLDYLNFTERKMKSFFNFLMLIFHQQIQQKDQLKLTVGKEWQGLLRKNFLTVQGILPHADTENSLFWYKLHFYASRLSLSCGQSYL